MNQKERLVELSDNVITSCKSSLCDDCEHNNIDYPNCMSVRFADKILADGWMRPPCEMGQTVYSYCEEFCRVFEYRVENIHLSEETAQYEAFCYIGMELADVIDFDDDDIGKTVFTSREDAEKALRGDEGK